jgi:hypothetical protein
MQRNKKSYFEYEKPSKHKQWQERSERVESIRPLTVEEIEDHLANLIASYGCEEDDISYTFSKIKDNEDEDRDDCLLLIYKMNCIIKNTPTTRDVFTIKVPVPEDLKRCAEARQRQAANRQRTNVRRPGARTTTISKITKTEEQPVVAPRTGIRRPMRL